MIPRMIAPRDKEEKEGGRTKVVGRLGVILENIMEVEFMVDEWLQRGLKLSSISMAHAYISWGVACTLSRLVLNLVTFVD